MYGNTEPGPLAHRDDGPSTSSLADAAVRGAPSASGHASLRAATFATFDRYAECVPSSERVSKDKLYSLARQGKIPVYRLPGVGAACVKVAEARAVLADLSAKGKIRRGYGSFGPDAVVRDLSKVADDFEVLQ